ncbi:MAG: GMC family oxidoreductase [Bacteroidales bacterium]|nr:GMC family oxidoreductase [Bacteroidales bacterium]
MEKVYDYIVIGSGFGGSVSAMRLAEKGYSVLVLEKGKRYRTEDFPKTNWNLPKYLWVPGLRMFGFQKLSFFKDASILSGVGVGGGSLVYANTLVKPPDEFFNNPSWSGFKDWKKELEPYYDMAHFMLGRTQYEELNYEDDILREVAKDFGQENTFEPVHVGVYFGDKEKEVDPYFNGLGPKRKGCTECAGCMVGCRENAKNSLDKNYLYFAEKSGVKVLAETKAEIIKFENDTYYVLTKSSTSFFPGRYKTYQTKGLIVAGGTLGTLNLLLKQKYKYNTLPNLSDKTGDNLLTNSQTLCAISGAKEKLNNGVAISSVFNPDFNTHIEIVKYPDGSNAMKWFYVLAVNGTRYSITRTLKLFWKTLTHPLQFLKTFFNFNWSTNLVIFLVMQSIDNSMKMVWKKGLLRSRMKIRNIGEKKVPAYIDSGQKAMEKYAKKVGGIPQNIILEILFNRPTTAHILGGCPMSESSESGVINHKLEVHGYPNMYIIDGSAIQGNLGINPGFTITSLAEYAMDQIKEKEGNQTLSLLRQIEKSKITT